MTLQEFKAWFEGFTESMSGPPNKKQWERIQARVKEINGTAVTHHYWHEHYWPTARPWFTGTPYYPWYTTSNINVLNDGHTMSCNAADLQQQSGSFTPTVAMQCLGKAEYQDVA